MTVKLLSREQCGLAAPNPARLTLRHDAIIGITVHVTATAEPDHHPTGTWAAIQRAEMSGNDPDHAVYGDISYNAGITLDGTVLAGRDGRWRGAHALSHDDLANRCTLGIAVVGNGHTVSQAAEDALRACGGLFRLAYHRAPQWWAHSDWDAPDGSYTTCPDGWLAVARRARAERW